MIPSVIHQMFVNPHTGGAGGLNQDVRTQCAEWQRRHPSYDYRMWTLPDFLALCAQESRSDVADAVLSCRFPAMQVDIARLLILKTFGGFWADLKMYPLCAFLDGLRGHPLVLAEHFIKAGWKPGLPCSAFLGAEPGHAFFETALALAVRRVAERTPQTFRVAGPAALQEAVWQHFTRHDAARDFYMLPEFHMLPQSQTWDKWFKVGSGSYNDKDDKLHWSQRERAESPYADPLPVPAAQAAPPTRSTGWKPQMPKPADSHQAVLLAWAMEQVAPWLSRPLPPQAIRQEMHRLHAEIDEVALIRIENGDARVLPKPPGSPNTYPQERVEAYQMWLEGAVRTFCPELRTTVAVYPVDGALPDPPAPVFSFQKPAGNRSLLLPDFEMLGYGFPSANDRTAYFDKQCRAIFVGGTTGGLVTKQSVLPEGGLPRILAAQYFKDCPDVTFRLPQIVQYDSQETFDMLRAMGFGDGQTVGWDEQLLNRFVISMDGNGASCSRIFMTLSSNSVLMKYDSPNILYYFSGIRPWVHYIPVAGHEDVLRYIQIERENPGFFEPVALAGQEFAAAYFNRRSASHYTAYLLQLYTSLLLGGDAGD